MALHCCGRHKSNGLWRSTVTSSVVLCVLFAAATNAAYSKDKPRPPEITVLEAIDLGDILVMKNDTVEVEVATNGHRTSRLGQPIFGSLPFGSGRLRLLGEPNTCVRLTAHNVGRSTDSGRIRVRRVLLRSSNVKGQEEIHLRLDSDGLAVVDVGVKLHLSAIGRSNKWQLSLSFEAQNSDDCLH